MSARTWLASLSERTRLLFYAGIPGVVGGCLGYTLVHFDSINSFMPNDLLSMEENILFPLIFAGIVLEVGAFYSWKADDKSKQLGYRWIP
jgi:hypothetical protein